MGEQRRREIKYQELDQALRNSSNSNERRKLIDEFTKAMIGRGKIIEAGWLTLRAMAIPPDAPQAQLDEMRMAFFAGAQHLFGSLSSSLDEDAEPTEADMARMEKINDELNEFIEDFKLRHSTAEGSA